MCISLTSITSRTRNDSGCAWSKTTKRMESITHIQSSLYRPPAWRDSQIDGEVPWSKTKKRMESITHIQSSLYGESEPRVLREGCGYSSYTLGSGLYTPQNRNSMVRATPLQGRRPRPSSFGPPPPIHQITHLAGCPAVQFRRAHTWSASCACEGE